MKGIQGKIGQAVVSVLLNIRFYRILLVKCCKTSLLQFVRPTRVIITPIKRHNKVCLSQKQPFRRKKNETI